MPKAKWGIDADEPEELQGFEEYDGPEPPRGVYDFVLKRLQVKENRNGDDMLNGLLEIRTSNPDKKKYNGYGLWFNQNVTDQGKPYVLQFLKSMGLTWQDFMKRTVFESEERPTNITKIGAKKFNDGNEVPLRASLKMGRAQGDYPARLEVSQFLPPKDEDWDDDAADDGDDDGSDSPF